ncbi:MAG: hypothetical protein WC841_03375 [Candidatus Shapirobacteria bacterium]|jgi:hypothetical protein
MGIERGVQTKEFPTATRYQFSEWDEKKQEYVWTDGKETLAGEKGQLSVGHYEGEGLREALRVNTGMARFVLVDNGTASLEGQIVDSKSLVYIPAGASVNLGEVQGGAWIVEVTATLSEENTKATILPVSVNPTSHAAWFGSWTSVGGQNLGIPPSIHFGIEEGSVTEIITAGLGTEYTPWSLRNLSEEKQTKARAAVADNKNAELLHGHNDTTEIYVCVENRTVVDIQPNNAPPTNEIDHQQSVPLGPGMMVVVGPSTGYSHREPSPIISGKMFVIKWNGGEIVDRNDKHPHPLAG